MFVNKELRKTRNLTTDGKPFANHSLSSKRNHRTRYSAYPNTTRKEDAVVVEIAESNETGETKKKHKRGEELNIFFPSFR